MTARPNLGAPGTHYSSVAQGRTELRSLPDTFRHDQQWESSPRSFNLKSSTLFTRQQAKDKPT